MNYSIRDKVYHVGLFHVGGTVRARRMENMDICESRGGAYALLFFHS